MRVFSKSAKVAPHAPELPNMSHEEKLLRGPLSPGVFNPGSSLSPSQLFAQ
jgi:hypothetical protein